MVNFFKSFLELFEYILKYHKFYIIRWIKSLTTKPGKLLKVIPPESFQEAIFALTEMAQEYVELKTIMNNHTTSEEFATIVHHGLGQDIRNEWKLWIQNSKLHKDINKTFSLFHADDMSSLITQTTWQRFMAMPETPYSIAHGYLKYWKNMKEDGEWDGVADGSWDGPADGGMVAVEFKDIQKAYMKMEDKAMDVHIEHLKAKNDEYKIDNLTK